MYFDKNLNEFKLGNSRIPKTNSRISKNSKVKSRIPRNSSLGILEFLRLKYPRTLGQRM